MKMLIILCCLMMGTAALAQHSTRKDYGYLKPDEQKYFQNGTMTGKNQMERIDDNVRAINDIYGKMEAMEKEIVALKNELAQSKASKPAK